MNTAFLPSMRIMTKLAKVKAEVAQHKRETKAATAAKAGANLKIKYIPLIDNMRQLLDNQHDHVKCLVCERKIGMNDVSSRGSVLLIHGQQGDYDIAQLCINLGGDIDAKNDIVMTALDYARRYSAYDCEKFLLLCKLNVNVSNNVQNIAFNMNKQNGIIENILNEMNNIIKDKNEKIKFMYLFATILCKKNNISKRLSFSNDLLNLCLIYNTKTDSNALWKVLISTCNDILMIENENKKAWYYFKTFIITSNV